MKKSANKSKPKKGKKAKQQKAVKPSDPNKLPNKITCTACKQTKGVRPDVLQKRLKDYGTLENLFATYECQKCRKLAGSKAPTASKARKMGSGTIIDEETGKRIYFWQVPGYELPKPAPFNFSTIDGFKRAYGTTCANPPLFLDNGRFCDGCPYFDVCSCALKRRKGDGGIIETADGEKKMSYYMKKKLGLLKWQKKS